MFGGYFAVLSVFSCVHGFFEGLLDFGEGRWGFGGFCGFALLSWF